MKSKIFINGGLILIFILFFGMGIDLFSQAANNVAVTIDQPEYELKFDRLVEYTNQYDEFQDEKDVPDEEIVNTNFFQAKRSTTSSNNDSVSKILTVNYMENGRQTQNMSKIPYRDKDNLELWYINNEVYNRPFFTIRYELSGDSPDNARIIKKELINKERKVEEYYEFKYDTTNRVESFTRYALSPFRDEFQQYESAEFFYDVIGGAGGGTGDGFYYNVMDKDGLLKFTYSSIPPSFFNNVNEVFVQYRPGADRPAIVKSQAEGEEGTLNMIFNPDNIQFVIAAQTSVQTQDVVINQGTPEERTIQVTEKTFPFVYIYNGDGSLREVRSE